MIPAKQKIVDTLTPMFRQAEAERLWFHSLQGDIWITPKELQAKQADGLLCFGADFWELRNPIDRLCQLHDQMEQSKKHYQEFGEKLIAMSYVNDIVESIEEKVKDLIV